MKTHELSGKRLVEKYELRIQDTGDCWANIYIDDYEGAGRILIVSDYNSKGWTCYLTGCGSSFKEFLTKIPNMECFAEKLNVEMVFDMDATIGAMWETLNSAFVMKQITKEAHFDMKQELKELDLSNKDDKWNRVK